MPRLKHLFALTLPASLFPLPALHAQRRAITIEDYLALKNVGDPQVSPDGKWVVYTVGTVSLQDDKSTSRLWLASTTTGAAKELSQGTGSDRSPRWSPDGQTIAFLSGREHGPQVWVMPAAGGAARRVSDLPDGVGEMYWMPDGKGFLVVSDIKWPQEQEIDRRNGPYPTDARLWTNLLYRHWTDWRAGMRQHVFSVDLASGAARDLTPIDKDAPTIATSGDGDVAMSPDGKEVAVAIHADTVVADNTNVDIYLLGPDGGGMRDLTTTNAGADNTPRFSPDGKWLSYLSMSRPGFEADRLRLMLVPRSGGRTAEGGTPLEATAGWNLSVSAYSWCADSKCLYAVVDERGHENLYRISLPGYQRTLIFGGNGTNTNLTVSTDGKTRAWLYQSNTLPAEVFVNDQQLTHTNDELLSHLDLHPLESYGFIGANGDSVFGWLLKPPGFDPGKKYPVVYLIHGGPQGAWHDEWHARWNYQMFASRGYVVAAVNFHGSTGYGQPFTDAISQHWGDWPYVDVMRGLDAVARLPYVDSTRMGAAGASYGGYMVYWLAGHTDRFKVLVDHDGVFNPESMFGTTEELWFPKWEFGGTPYREAGGNRARYEQWDPLNYVQNWRTPMLIVHSQIDYRVDLSEGYQAFTALKLHDVPAKFLYFPDEGHFVVRPRDRRLWWGVVLDWLDQYLKN